MAFQICLIVGARPNFMKVAPVHTALARLAPDAELQLVHTGQHYDDRMSRMILADLGLPEPDVFLGVGSGTHAEQTARALIAIERVLLATQPDLLVVAGDVNSTLAGAMAAVKLNVPVAHIESGLRSFDDRMPEEHNRRLTDHVSSVLLAHSESAVDNLRSEGVPDDRIHLVGNTMIDTMLRHLDGALAAAPWEAFGLEPENYSLVTLHRPALVDEPALLAATVRALEELARDVPTLFPVHPRTRARIEELGLKPHGRGLQLTEPLGYLQFLGLEARARFVLTDSGGIQEETSALGVPCFTLRDSTERPITITHGTNVLLGADPERISDIPRSPERPDKPAAIPLWDGAAGARCAIVLARYLDVVRS